MEKDNIHVKSLGKGIADSVCAFSAMIIEMRENGEDLSKYSKMYEMIVKLWEESIRSGILPLESSSMNKEIFDSDQINEWKKKQEIKDHDNDPEGFWYIDHGNEIQADAGIFKRYEDAENWRSMQENDHLYVEKIKLKSKD